MPVMPLKTILSNFVGCLLLNRVCLLLWSVHAYTCWCCD